MRKAEAMYTLRTPFEHSVNVPLRNIPDLDVACMMRHLVGWKVAKDETVLTWIDLSPLLVARYFPSGLKHKLQVCALGRPLASWTLRMLQVH